MEDEAAFWYFNSIASSFLNNARYNIENKVYKDAVLNLYKAEEWRDYFIVTGSQSKKSSFAKEIQKARYELKKAVSKDKVLPVGIGKVKLLTFSRALLLLL